MSKTGKMLAAVAAVFCSRRRIGVLVAPDKGSETRRKLLGRKKKMLERIKDKIGEEQKKMARAEEEIKLLMKERLSCTPTEKVTDTKIGAL
jgi:gas vesicle protein